jgi:hypothetical protein
LPRRVTPQSSLARPAPVLTLSHLGLVLNNLQSARRARRYRLANRCFTRPLLVNHKLPVDDLKHCRETFDTVPGMDAHVGVIGDLHGFLRMI